MSERRIRLFDTSLPEGCAEAVAEQVRSGMIGPGERVKEFERLLCDKLGVNEAVCTTSGTTALMLALMALDLPRGSTVLFPSFGMPAGAHAAMMLGFNVRLMPSDDLLFCPASDVSAAICVLHNGQGFAWLPRFAEAMKEQGIAVVIDACQAMGVEHLRSAPEYGPTCLSFAPQKLVTTGQGGAVLTRDGNTATRVRQLIDHGGNWREDRRHVRLGGNFRMTDIQAALGVAQMQQLESIVAKRKQVRDWYREHAGIDSDEWCVTYRAFNAERLIGYLSGHGIEAAQLYRPMRHHSLFSDRAEDPVAEQAWRQSVYLPSHNGLTEDDVKRIANALKESGWQR